MALKTPITYYGGKQNLVSKILPLLAQCPHTTYVEPFVGGGAIFWAKPKSEVEIINDLNREVVNFYKVLQSDFKALQAKVLETPHSRALHKDANVIYQNPHMFSDVERAWAFWVATNLGFAGMIGKGWKYGTTSNTSEKGHSNKKKAFLVELQQRLDLVQIECKDALEIIKWRDREGTLFYCDPPYFNSDCGHYDGYSEADFKALLESLSQLKGKFLLSSYPSAILDEFVERFGWKQEVITGLVSVNTKSGTKKVKHEVLTYNF